MKYQTVILSAAKNLLLLSVIAGLTGHLLTGCTARYEKLNTNPNQVTAEQMEVKNYRTGTKVTNLQNLVVPVEEHIYQFVESLSGGPYAGYIGSTVNTWLDRFETFNETPDWRKWPFSNVMTEMYAPYRAIINETDDELALAFAHLFRVATMHRVTDSYGPVPYSDAVSNEGLYVKYDSQEKVYEEMFEELELAISQFKANEGIDPAGWKSFDRVYYGNIAQWSRFANSLKLRMAMRLSYVKPELSREKASEAIAAGVITTNADNALMHAVENRTALIYNGWQDHRVGADIICYMNGYEDPRREKMFLPAVRGGGFAGVRVGSVVSSKTDFVECYSNMLVNTDTPYLWMNAAEVTFLRAEYELRWGSAESAKELYEQAIRLSFEEKGASGADAYIADNSRRPDAYTDPLGAWSVGTRPSNVTIAWDDTAIDIETNLEKIITQKWIAIFPLGVEAWSEYRRTGYPRLFDAAQDLSGGAVDVHRHARRLRYPLEEHDQNKANVEEAIRLLNSEATGEGTRNGDEMSTRVWWDVKPYND